MDETRAQGPHRDQTHDVSLFNMESSLAAFPSCTCYQGPQQLHPSRYLLQEPHFLLCSLLFADFRCHCCLAYSDLWLPANPFVDWCSISHFDCIQFFLETATNSEPSEVSSGNVMFVSARVSSSRPFACGGVVAVIFVSFLRMSFSLMLAV